MRSPESARFADYSVQACCSIFSPRYRLFAKSSIDGFYTRTKSRSRASTKKQVLLGGSVTLLPKARGPSIESDGECWDSPRESSFFSYENWQEQFNAITRFVVDFLQFSNDKLNDSVKLIPWHIHESRRISTWPKNDISSFVSTFA